MRGATKLVPLLSAAWKISTHAPHARRDLLNFYRCGKSREISTHAPHALLVDEGDAITFQLTRLMRGATHSGQTLSAKYSFQLTCLLRGATISDFFLLQSWLFQLTRPMRGATIPAEMEGGFIDISTHAPHARRDPSQSPYLQPRL